MTDSLSALSEPGLPQIFTPTAAAELLRAHGLTSITECALRTRAYRKQVPFHLNGRRIVFTLADLAEIAEGQARQPQPREAPTPRAAMPRPQRRRPTGHCTEPPDSWRARRPSHPSSSNRRHG